MLPAEKGLDWVLLQTEGRFCRHMCIPGRTWDLTDYSYFSNFQLHRLLKLNNFVYRFVIRTVSLWRRYFVKMPLFWSICFGFLRKSSRYIFWFDFDACFRLVCLRISTISARYSISFRVDSRCNVYFIGINCAIVYIV